ncbi:hypothetical protein TrLO_g2497 [Triparma laevis f. longispina]|uniref:Uncharacterized protein n=1 Tax=Triparma laevis f. longispina TaxID=1714387 RepID=A0A9W7CEH8_9STRA|nr:hypothetical protein TrLO_g2497 [Triparma laevis f. longispina]
MISNLLTSLGLISDLPPPPTIDLPHLQLTLTNHTALLSELTDEISKAEITLQMNDSIINRLLEERKKLNPDDGNSSSNFSSPQLNSLDSTLHTLQITTEIQRYTLISLRNKRKTVEELIKIGRKNIEEIVREEAGLEDRGENDLGVEGRELMDRV